jgi:ATP adenylyltransferase
MKYFDLYNFINKRMRMSHIYQPVMLITLLKNRGKCSQETIARNLLAYDKSQLEYYVTITNRMVGKVLRNHSIVEKTQNTYVLNDFESFSEGQIAEIINLCKQKLNEYINKRGDRIWSHRRISSGDISGTLRYEVLKRSKFHCELCGVSADVRALEVDHIQPRSLGGGDELSNLQALCYICNATKGNRDDTSLREVRESYKVKVKSCIFCTPDKDRKIVLQNELAYTIFDSYPVTEQHALIIPRRHTASYFELGQAEINATTLLLNQMKKYVESTDKKVSGYNIGINDGSTSGQTIPHCHIHLIPRRQGDVQKPQGGIRHVIPGKGFYNV